MGIESNVNDHSPAGATAQESQANQSSFTGADLGGGLGAPGGSGDFLNLISKIGISRIDSSVEPYLDKVLKLVKDNLSNVTLVRLQRISNSYAVRYDGPDGVVNFFGIQFVSASDPVSQQFYPASIRLRPMHEELREMFADKKIRMSDARIILAGYEPDMAKFYEMADTIVRTFQVTSTPELKNAQIMSLTSNEFAVDWRLSEARNAENSLSPHGIRPRMDIGCTVKAKIKNDLGREFREFDTDYRTLGVIGGYTEIREKEEFTINNQRVMMYQPVFNITVCNANIPLEGVASILLATFAPTIYSTLFWAKQWNDLSDGQPNPGMLEENPDSRGKPIVLKDQEELLDFVRTYFATPVIVFQFQDGRDSIPGMWRLAATTPEAKNHFVGRLTNFFGTAAEDSTSAELSRVVETRFDGAYGDPNGILHDSRDIDYLYITARNGWASVDHGMRRVLLGGSENSTDRARLIQTVTNSFIPLFLNSMAVVNPDFVKWIIQKTDARRLVLIDPNSQAESRSIGSFINGFGSTQNMGSIVSNGATNRGLNLSSVWN